MSEEPVNSEQVSKTNRIINAVKKVVAEYYGMPESAYEEKNKANPNKFSRKEEYIKLRRMAMYILKFVTPKIALNVIGKAFGNFDHATVLHHQRVMEDLCDTEKKLNQEANEILETLNNEYSVSGFRLNKEFYYVDLNDMKVLRISQNHALIFVGITEDVMNKIKQEHFKNNQLKIDVLKDTGLFILDKKHKK